MIKPLMICAALSLPLALGACESMGMGGSTNTASASTVSKDSSGAPGPISQTTQNSGGERATPGPQNP